MNRLIKATAAVSCVLLLVLAIILFYYDFQYHRVLTLLSNDQFVRRISNDAISIIESKSSDYSILHNDLHDYGITNTYVYNGAAIGLPARSVVIEFGGADHHYGFIITQGNVSA